MKSIKKSDTGFYPKIYTNTTRTGLCSAHGRFFLAMRFSIFRIVLSLDLCCSRRRRQYNTKIAGFGNLKYFGDEIVFNLRKKCFTEECGKS